MEFHAHLLRPLVEDEPGMLDDALDELIRAGLIEPPASPGASHRFAHALTRRAAYERIPAGQRARLHLAVGERLEATLEGEVRAEQAAQLAEHFDLAADPAVSAPMPGAGATLRRAHDGALERLVEHRVVVEVAALVSQSLQATDRLRARLGEAAAAWAGPRSWRRAPRTGLSVKIKGSAAEGRCEAVRSSPSLVRRGCTAERVVLAAVGVETR